MANSHSLNGREQIIGQFNTLPYDRKVEVAKALEKQDRHKAASLLGVNTIQISNADASKLGTELILQLRSEAEKPVNAAVVNSEDERTAKIVQAAMAGTLQALLPHLSSQQTPTMPAGRTAQSTTHEPQQYNGPAQPSKIGAALKAATPSALKGFITLLLTLFVVVTYLLWTKEATFDSSLVNAVEHVAKTHTVVLALLLSGIGVLVHFYNPIGRVTLKVLGVVVGWPVFYVLTLVETAMVPVVLLPIYIAQGVRMFKLGIGNLSNCCVGEYSHVNTTAKWKPVAKSITYLAPSMPVLLEVGEVKA